MRFICIKKILKLAKFKNKVRKQLPNFHSETGQRLDWDISIYYKNIKYCEGNGKVIKGYPFLIINQKAPSGMIVDNRAFTFDWKKRELKATRAIWQ